MITIRHGCSELTRDVNGYDTYGDLVADANVAAVLGNIDASRVDVLVDGAVVDLSDAIQDGDVVVLVTKSNRKGA